MALAHFRVLINELLNKDPDIVPEEASLIIFDSKSSVCMAKNGKDTKHTRHIARRVNIVNNGKTAKCIILTDVREVFNWQTLSLTMLVSMI